MMQKGKTNNVEKERMMSSNPFFEVVRQPLKTMWTDPELASHMAYGAEVEIPVGRDALINGETGKVVGVVAPKYKFVHNSDLAEKIDWMVRDLPVIEMNDHLDSRGSRWVRDIMLDGNDYTLDMTGAGDIVKTKLRFFNSYDGKSSAGWSISAWRKICSNGMMGWRSIFSKRLAHLSEDVLERFHKMFVEKHLLFSNELDRMKVMTKIPFSKTQYEVFVLNQDLPDRTMSKLIGYYDTAMNKWNEDETRWGVYNVLTAYATHETKARGGSNIFSAGYQQVEAVVSNFLDWNPTAEQYEEAKEKAIERLNTINA